MCLRENCGETYYIQSGMNKNSVPLSTSSPVSHLAFKTHPLSVRLDSSQETALKKSLANGNSVPIVSGSNLFKNDEHCNPQGQTSSVPFYNDSAMIIVDAKVCQAKPDIRLGTGAIRGLPKSTTPGIVQGPPKPPRTSEAEGSGLSRYYGVKQGGEWTESKGVNSLEIEPRTNRSVANLGRGTCEGKETVWKSSTSGTAHSASVMDNAHMPARPGGESHLSGYFKELAKHSENPGAQNETTHHRYSKKKESRRHTLQSGVDYSMMRRLRQLEAERDMLFQGFEVVEKARLWYKHQLQKITEKLHYLPTGSLQAEPSIEAQQERLHFQLARIHEVNAHLCALMETSEQGFVAHVNLALRGPETEIALNTEEGSTVSRLKAQNHLLTQEVSAKSEKITVLEREKATLLRELFQMKGHQQLHNNLPNISSDSAFI